MIKPTITRNELTSFLHFCESNGCNVRHEITDDHYQIAAVELPVESEELTDAQGCIYRNDKNARLAVDPVLCDLLVAYNMGIAN